ncbi:BRCT domain-containing protein [Pectobacterium carotovorum]|uniref:hypothetical protein n=1 Tax=Pectobacterium carotovorum TaxID=554 RepID=UPI00380D42C1
MDDRIIFVYINSRGLANIQVIEDASQNDDYIQGFSVLEKDYGNIKTFRKDRILDFFPSFEEAKLFYDVLIDIGYLVPTSEKLDTFDVCFTGFKKEKRTELEEIASSKDMVVRKSVTKHLKLLCYGYNAGPTKIRDARNMGILIFNEEQFMNFVETGEIAE